MAQADGSIILETGVDLDGFAAGSKDLEKAARNTARNIKGISVTTQASLQKQADAIAKINQQYANQKANIEALEQKIKEVGAQKVETEEYKKLNLEIQKTEAALDRAIEKQIKFTETGGKIDSRAFRAMEYDIAQITEKLDEARRKKAQLESSGGAYQGADTSGLTKRLATEEEKLTKIHKRLSESYGNLKTKAALYERKVNDLSSTTSKLHNITRSLTSGMKKMLVSMAGLNKQSKSTELTFGKMLATSLMFSGVYAALSIVMNGLQTGFENLAQYSTETNTSISSLISALTYLKNAFATAFAPILQVVSPLLTAFINMIARAVTYIGMFFAALTGQKTFQKAIPVQEDYAASLRDTANSAKDAADATKEAAKATSDYLSPLDEISRYETSDTIATGGNQASGSLPGYTPPSPEEMFETVPIETSISDFVAKIKALIEAQDWDDLGALLGSKINSITQVVKDAIDWDNVDPHVTYFVTAFTATFNSLVSAINWSLIGQTVGSGINTIVNTLSLLITGIGWKTLGASFALGANGMFNEVDWYALGALLGQKFMIAWNTFWGFVTNLDWAMVGNSIGTAINGAIANIDPVTIMEGINAFVLGILTAITTAAETTDWTAVGQKIADMLKTIDWTGIATQLYDAGKELINGLLEAFRELPEPVILATALIVGFWAATQLLSSISTITAIIKGMATAISGSSGLIAAVKAIVALLGGKTLVVIGLVISALILLVTHWDEVKAFLVGFCDWLKEGFLRVFAWVFDTAVDIGSTLFDGISETIGGIKEIFLGLVTFLGGICTGDWKTAWEGLVQMAGGIFKTLTAPVKTVINGIIVLINSMISAVETALNWVISGANKISFTIPDWIPEIGGKSFGINITPVAWGRIPELATGTVIPPNASKFLAMLGDNNRETEVVSPLSTMKQAMLEALAESGGMGGGNYRFTAQINRRILFEEMIEEAKLRQDKTGENPFDLVRA